MLVLLIVEFAMTITWKWTRLTSCCVMSFELIPKSKNFFFIGRYVPIVEKERGNKRNVVEENSMINRNDKRTKLFVKSSQMIVPMYFNPSTSMILYGNEQLLSSCCNTVWPCLFLHFYYTWYVTLQMLCPFVILFTVLW